MATKHELIIQYIESLAIGEKISVRTIAKSLKMSEGTAYRAIKDAENIGLVSTIERVGTIRIERKTKRNFESLTYDVVEKIIDGKVLGGRTGIHKVLNKFVIGAMQEDAMLRYITPDSLMIVGNRTSVQRLALESGAAVLITGGFETTQEIVQLANEVEMPIMTTSYDTFTVATMINRAMSDQLIKKEIVLVENIYTPLEQTLFLKMDDTIVTYRDYNQQTDHSRFPVVSANGRLVGIVTAKDIMGKPEHYTMERVMTKTPTVAKLHMSVASVSHMMIWDGLDVMPVVEDNMQLIGIVSRRDVMKAMQLAQRQPQVGDTIEDQIVSSLEVLDNDVQSNRKDYRFRVEPQMLNSVGTISYGVLSEIVAESAQRIVFEHQKNSVILEQIQLHYFKLIQNENTLTIQCRILDANRRSTKVDVEIYCDNSLYAKAIVSCQMISRT